ncbi:hypothetical protein IX307_000889 [Bacteroides pyogenes]|uniref:hypothetical protein n=1 Tax=Bacteroides pyogenes TaxID=310300 RepID=UPI0011E43312|nr:hypothetical protein [Bacteroides pyogenes]MBR8706225.1 hypothetical protein [Bacteroides pyogenes]MBR8707501.1 hypothetical protein [Bacteroides pyogenes]MBR8716303.1 hypothetical protein [Bacteroides pyogenes]MBR8719578.1 hypothetical protein [Bacteroides pyogenes]MBR8745761.1 hypothetical protein [Bacteroides pyogenes]
MKPEFSLSARQSVSTSICSSCKRELPLDCFYMNKKNRCPDSYCKECRKDLSRRQYTSEKAVRIASSVRLPYPVITEIEDRETRIRFIMNALRVVQLSVERKRRRMQEEEEEALM